MKLANKLIDEYMRKYRLRIKKKAVWVFRQAENIEKTGNNKKALAFWNKFGRDYGRVLSDDKKIEIEFKQGDIYKRAGKMKLFFIYRYLSSPTIEGDQSS